MLPHLNKTIWIDLENSPHVFFFKPIINDLEKKGYKIILTARDCFQVCGLADENNLNYKKIGRHYGKNKILKAYGLLFRSFQLAQFILKNKPRIAVSHCSRTQILTATMLGIPSVSIYDYEHSTQLKSTWGIIPEVIPDNLMRRHFKKDLLKYPGIKEDVYVPSFKPDTAFKKHLSLNDHDLVVTIRPPATEAHYHNPQSESLFDATMKFLSDDSRTKVVILPRNKNQEAVIRNEWGTEISEGKFVIPDRVVDGLNLIWHSDLVISGGGTMNREAAALGVPVYSIFRGKIGAVDKYLAREGRLILLESADDVKAKIRLSYRSRRPSATAKTEREALNSVVNSIMSIMEKEIQ